MDLEAIQTIIASVRDLINADGRTAAQDDRLAEYLRSACYLLGAAGDHIAEAIMVEQDRVAEMLRVEL